MAERVPLLASAMTLGNALFQIPLGLLADRFDKRIILLICGVTGFAGMVAAWTVAASPAVLMAVLFVWGGVTGGLYTVGLAHLASRFSGAALASTGVHRAAAGIGARVNSNAAVTASCRSAQHHGPATEAPGLCVSCRLNHTIPDLGQVPGQQFLRVGRG